MENREQTEAELRYWQMRWARLAMRAYNESPEWRNLGIHQDDDLRRTEAHARIAELERELVIAS